MGEQLEDIKKSPGRPAKDEKKIIAPSITLREETILKMREIAARRSRSQSEIYQEALDFYIGIVDRNRNVVTL